jgi:GTP-binding protein HflX
VKKGILLDITDKRESRATQEARIDELTKLVQTHGKVAIAEVFSKKTETDMKLFLREGLRDEVILKCRETNAQVLVLGNILKPRQIFELSEVLRKEGVEVWDRVDLILKIFSHHAQSAEAKLQIELAKIRHMGPRIFGMGDELSRQGGGKGAKGQGETNTEVMKRHLHRERMNIEAKLEKIEKTKSLHRQRRSRQNFKTVSLVGYTNAGKSSLMNTLSKKGVAAEDALFKTLDTRIGKMYLPDLCQEICISDTIGFIDDLPPNLISAFHSTLSEAIESDIILHVVDVSDPRRHEKIRVVDQILEELEIGEDKKKQILVFNKTDIAGEKFGQARLKKKYYSRNPIFLSAKDKTGLNNLQKKIEQFFQ